MSSKLWQNPAPVDSILVNVPNIRPDLTDCTKALKGRRWLLNAPYGTNTGVTNDR